MELLQRLPTFGFLLRPILGPSSLPVNLVRLGETCRPKLGICSGGTPGIAPMDSALAQHGIDVVQSEGTMDTTHHGIDDVQTGLTV